MKYDFTQYVTKDSVMSLDGRNKLEVMDQLITRAADLTKLNRDVIFRLTWKREQMNTKVFNTAIRECIKVKEAQARKQTLIAYAPKCTAAEDYNRLADELIG